MGADSGSSALRALALGVNALGVDTALCRNNERIRQVREREREARAGWPLARPSSLATVPLRMQADCQRLRPASHWEARACVYIRPKPRKIVVTTLSLRRKTSGRVSDVA